MWRSIIKRQGFATNSSRYAIETARRAQSIEKDLKEGSEVEGFIVNRVAQIPEFFLTLIKLRHMRTGCEYLHLARDDSNNAFCVGFRTTPTDSTGLPHILEHTTLCGSKRYPCRDPFMKMLNRSMATFMNAMTGPDYTIYPFSTQNYNDYRNLMSVYLDAVFQPELRENDFRQEGWRLEHESTYDKNSPIIFKGVVFNEMKGVYSENQTIFQESLMNSLLPSHTYGVHYGGDPKSIPTLTYNDLKAFHKKFYHPSNCRIYSYGNFPLIDHLAYVNKVYLADYPDITDYSSVTVVPQEKRWEQERRKEISCKFDPLVPEKNKQSSISAAVLCNDITDVQETFFFQVLSELLIRGPNSAFYKSLVEPNIGGGFNHATGYESQTRDTFFAVGLMGVDPKDFDRIIDIYNKTVDDVINKGFDENQIKAILHSIELGTKHQTSDFGLRLLFGITPIWNHGGDLIKAIQVNDRVTKFQKALASNKNYLKDMVKKYFKDNNHRLILTMKPDVEYEKKEEAAISSLLSSKLENLLPHQRESIFEAGIQLSKEQEANKNVDCLPCLKMSDINKDVERVELKGYEIKKVPVQVCTTPTNGLTYVRGITNSTILSDKAKGLLPVFCHVVTKMGTKKHNYRQFDQLINLKTSGIFFSPHIAENIHDCDSFEEGVLFSSSCLDKNVKDMTGLLEELFSSVNFNDIKRFETLVKLLATSTLTGISDSGHLYAMSAASSVVSPVSHHKDRFGGLTFVQTMKELSQIADLTETLELMKGIADIILKKKVMRVSVNVSPNFEEKAVMNLEGLLTNIPGDYQKPFEITGTSKMAPKVQSVHFVFPFQVNYAAMSLPAVEYAHKDYPVLRVLGRLLSAKYLHPRIREKGGAYGSGATISGGGNFNFYSFSDPNPLNSFDVFNGAYDWVNSGSEFTDQDIEEAKLGVLQSLDAPVPPSAKGTRQFLYGISDDLLQTHREIVMKSKKTDVIKAARYLQSKAQGRALLGPDNPDLSLRPNENWESRRMDLLK